MVTFQVADGVYGIDVGLFDTEVLSVYLFDDDEPTLVDAGTAAGTDRILAGMAECGVDPGDLSNVVLSHVHADHTGAASALVEAAPDVDVYIHEMTAPHVIDPTELIESSRRAMGEHYDLPHFGVWPDKPETAFETAVSELSRFDDWILDRHDATGSTEATVEAVARTLLDLSPPYDPLAGSFYAEIVTKGYLKQYELL